MVAIIVGVCTRYVLQFWAPGNLELFVLAPPMENTESQTFIVPFAKSALTSQQSPVSQYHDRYSHLGS